MSIQGIGDTFQLYFYVYTQSFSSLKDFNIQQENSKSKNINYEDAGL